MFNIWKLKTKQYLYDFPTSGFESVDKVRAELEDQSDWDNASDADQSELFCKERAALYGIIQPFSEEQGALIRYLVSRRAGPMIITYAWGIFSYLHTQASAMVDIQES